MRINFIFLFVFFYVQVGLHLNNVYNLQNYIFCFMKHFFIPFDFCFLLYHLLNSYVCSPYFCFILSYQSSYVNIFWFLILIDLNKPAYSYVPMLLLYQLPINYLKKICWMIIWFWHKIIPSYFGCYKINISMISYIFHSFYKNSIINQLEKNFFKNIFSLFLAFYSYQCMVLTELLDCV